MERVVASQRFIPSTLLQFVSVCLTWPTSFISHTSSVHISCFYLDKMDKLELYDRIHRHYCGVGIYSGREVIRLFPIIRRLSRCRLKVAFGLLMSHSFGRFSTNTMINRKDWPADVLQASLYCRATGRLKKNPSILISDHYISEIVARLLSFHTTHELWITTTPAGQRCVGIFLSFIHPITDTLCPGSSEWISLHLDMFLFFLNKKIECQTASTLWWIK